MRIINALAFIAAIGNALFCFAGYHGPLDGLGWLIAAGWIGLELYRAG